jgi:hypothetical protein
MAGAPATDVFDGGILLSELTDVMPTATLASVNNIAAEASYTIIIFPTP